MVLVLALECCWQMAGYFLTEANVWRMQSRPATEPLVDGLLKMDSKVGCDGKLQVTLVVLKH